LISPNVTDVHLVLRATEVLAATGAVVTTAELFALRSALRDDGLLSWRAHRLYHPRLARSLERLRVGTLLSYPAVLVLLGIRLLAALSLIIAAVSGRFVGPPLYLLTALGLVFTLRNSSGNDGSDQMTLIVLVALSCAQLIDTQLAGQTSVIFIAAQSSLAYGTSGLLKAKERGWRDGTYVTEILATSSFGNRTLLRLFRTNYLVRVWSGRLVAYGDCLLCVAVLLPPQACVLALALGVCLHLGIAGVLGLNTFLWAFLATYPAVIYVSSLLYHR
jgi:hypothetical protein